MHLMEDVFASDKLCLYAVMSNNATDHEFNVNNSTICVM